MREAEESSEEISAAGAENIREFSAAGLHELCEWRFQVLISLDYSSRLQEARLLLYPCAETEIAQPPSRRRRLNFATMKQCGAATVPNISKKSTAVFKDRRMHL
jgi:hypothetical protein